MIDYGTWGYVWITVSPYILILFGMIGLLILFYFTLGRRQPEEELIK